MLQIRQINQICQTSNKNSEKSDKKSDEISTQDSSEKP